VGAEVELVGEEVGGSDSAVGFDAVADGHSFTTKSTKNTKRKYEIRRPNCKMQNEKVGVDAETIRCVFRS
jgi:hypothetical protein